MSRNIAGHIREKTGTIGHTVERGSVEKGRGAIIGHPDENYSSVLDGVVENHMSPGH